MKTTPVLFPWRKRPASLKSLRSISAECSVPPQAAPRWNFCTGNGCSMSNARCATPPPIPVRSPLVRDSAAIACAMSFAPWAVVPPASGVAAGPTIKSFSVQMPTHERARKRRVPPRRNQFPGLNHGAALAVCPRGQFLLPLEKPGKVEGILEADLLANFTDGKRGRAQQSPGLADPAGGDPLSG